MTFNLLPWREKLRHKKNKILLVQFFVTFFMTLFLSLLIQVKNQNIIHQQEYRISHMKKPKSNELNQIEKNILSEMSAYVQFTEFLSKINILLPSTIYLTRLEKIDRSLQLLGRAPSHAEVLKLLDQFNKKFPNEKLSLSETSHNNKNNDEIEFELTYQLT